MLGFTVAAMPVATVPAPAAAFTVPIALLGNRGGLRREFGGGGSLFGLGRLGTRSARAALLAVRTPFTRRARFARWPVAALLGTTLLRITTFTAVLTARLATFAAMLGFAAAVPLLRAPIAMLVATRVARSALTAGCGGRAARRSGRSGRNGGFFLLAEPSEQAREESRLASFEGAGRACLDLSLIASRSLHGLGNYRCGLCGGDSRDDRLLPFALRFGFGRFPFRLFRGRLNQLVAGRHMFHRVEFVVAQPLNLVVRGFQMGIGNQHDVYLETRLEFLDFRPLLVEQEGGDIDGDLGMHRAGVFLHRLFLQDAQHVQRRRFGATNESRAAAARAADVRGFLQRGLEALTRELEQAEARDLADLHPGAVEMQRLAKAVFHLALVALRLHVDKIDDDQAAQIAQAQLARDLVGSLQVGCERGFLDVAALGGARRV
ncbi:MAG: hypothetical protein OEW21_19310, partial [Betaproteobacteria bacterium]|nr:hypothetical protein [Betaproteobacteria bacterium]